MFIDTAKIHAKAGKGGKGCSSLYRDKFTRRGIPDGGDGGKGADIIIKADRNLHTLLDFQYNRHFHGLHGGHGSGKNKKGKDASAIVIRVPCGCIIKDIASDCVLRDLRNDGEQVLVAKGGAGGRGNSHHSIATDGEAGEERELLFELKIIADVGIIGFPNTGKSTLITAISSARPKIAAYPFTTKSPILGVVGEWPDSFVIADIPGLIEGSAKGRGLGDRFLRHIERTRLLVHIIDMAGTEGRDPVEDYKIINNELKEHGKDVSGKPQIIAANKMDLEQSGHNLERFRKAVNKRIYPISALKAEGLEELLEAIRKKI